MSKRRKILLSITVLMVLNCKAVEDGIEDISQPPKTHSAIKRKLVQVNNKIASDKIRLDELKKQKELKHGRKCCRELFKPSRIDESSNTNIDSSQQKIVTNSISQPIDEQNSDCSKYLNSKKAGLTFIGILAVLKICFHYYMKHDHEKIVRNKEKELN